MPESPFLEVKNVYYSYPQSEYNALENINFSVNAGDYIALLGLNGSGKSTLARILVGLLEVDSGNIVTAFDTLAGIVFQQPKEQIVSGVVSRDTAFGPRNLSLTEAEIELRTMECLSVVSLADRASSRTYELSLGQTQKLAFSGILALFPDFLILDEVTAMLDPASRKDLLQVIDKWNIRGHTIIHVTHSKEEALRAKRIIVLDKGHIVFDSTKADFIASEYYKSIFKTFPIPQKSLKKSEEETLCVRNLAFSYLERKVFSSMSFSLKKGTLTAIMGASGCGKSTLFECIAGLKIANQGSVYANSRPVLALQESEVALFEPYAADDVAFGPKNRGVQGELLIESVQNAMNICDLPYKDFADRKTFSLSGGEKRRLSLAGIVALDADILIFDEPTSGLDPYCTHSIMCMLRKLADSGKTVLFSTHKKEEVLYADECLKWEELSANADETPLLKETALPQQNPSSQAKLLLNLQKISASVTAPPKIPPSFISKLPASIKILLFLLLFIATLASYPFWLCSIMFFCSFIYALLAHYPLKRTLKAYKTLFPWLLLFAIIQFCFYHTSSDYKDAIFVWKWLVITKVKIMNICKLFIRAPAVITLLGAFIFTTEERQVLDGTASLLKPLAMLKVPVRYFVLIIGIYSLAT